VSEIFSHSLGIISSKTAAETAQAVRDSWQNVWSAGATPLKSYFHPSVVYVEATAATVIDPIKPDLSAAAHSQFSPAQAGTGLGDMMPSQNALAVSLTAGVRPNGTPFKGRFYLPPLSTAVLGADGTLDTLATSALADAMKAWLDALSAGGYVPAVWSRTVASLQAPVVSIRVGNKVDTIRSRRNALPEVYQQRMIAG
jgi:heme exporter protein D